VSDAVIVGIITVCGSIIIQLIISHASAKDLYAKLDKQSEISDAKIQGEIDVIKTEVSNLRQEVAKHNGLIERTYKLERDYAVLDNKVKVADNRIADLENHRAG